MCTYGLEELASSQATPWTTAGSAAEIDSAQTATHACMGGLAVISEDGGELHACMHRAPSTATETTQRRCRRDVRTT
jgi:hypothetical protein